MFGGVSDDRQVQTSTTIPAARRAGSITPHFTAVLHHGQNNAQIHASKCLAEDHRSNLSRLGTESAVLFSRESRGLGGQTSCQCATVRRPSQQLRTSARTFRRKAAPRVIRISSNAASEFSSASIVEEKTAAEAERS
jgi:hypothetical protein